MPVTSTTLAGVNVWRFSGNVTDAEIRAAWSALIVNQRYKPGRYIYIDDTCSLVNARGTYYIDCEALGLILHSSRNKANTVLTNWVLTQTAGLSVVNRGKFVQFTNGSTITTNVGDGVDMKGGAMIYAVQGNNGGGDGGRWLNEMMFGALDGTNVTSATWTEQEMEPSSIGTVWKGIRLQRCAGFPILQQTGGLQRQVLYRCELNTEGTQRIVRPYYNNSVCYVSCLIRRNGAPVTSNVGDTFGSSSSVIMVANNWLDEGWFGASKTAFTFANWNGGNRVIGVAIKKIQVQPSTLIRTYDSRSTTAAQKSTFSETTSDFLTGTDSTTSDATTGRATIVCVGAIATGGGQAITRYSGQKYTLQKFAFRVLVQDPDMTTGDDDLSAFSPVIMAAQNGLVRDLAAITAATSMEAYRELLEELHALAITLVGSASYNAPFGGNLFELSGNTLVTAFTSVLVDKTAAQKISYNATTGALVIRSNTLASSTTVTQWSNTTGPITTANGAAITGVYADSNGQRVRVFGLDPEGFGVTWYLRHRVKGTTEWTNLSGTGNQTLVILTAGEYEFQARVPGYDWDDAEIDTAVSLSLDMALRYQVSANNTPQYTMIYDAVLEAIFQYDATAMKVSVANTTAGILSPGFAELYQATQRIQHIPALVWSWTSPVTANATSQKILIPTGNPISMYLTDASDASVKITCPVIHSDTGLSADDRVRGNADGFQLILGSPATAESAGLAAQIISGLGGAAYTEADASQMALKALIDEVQTLVTQVKARTDLVPDEPAAAGDAMTLTAAYDAAKTAATQTSVDGVATAVTALGEPLQAADYVEPATAEAIATQVEVQIINEDDGRAVLQAIADKIMAEEISSTIIAQSVRAELATELGRIDVAISTRSTLTAEDIPEGLTAAEVWSATTRTLTEAAGLTTEQAEQLAALPTLAEIESTTVLAKAADVEGLPTLADIEGSAILAKSADVEGLPTASDTAAAVLGATVETGATVAQSLRLANAVLGGKVSGGQTGTETFRDLADTKDVVVSTNDAAGNRTAVVTNLS
jgi:hypothetical protein